MSIFYNPTPTNFYDDYIAHHGILGMKWGKKNGPPYPLGSGDHSKSERSAGWKKSLGGGRNEEMYDRKKKFKAANKVATVPKKKNLNNEKDLKNNDDFRKYLIEEEGVPEGWIDKVLENKELVELYKEDYERYDKNKQQKIESNYQKKIDALDKKYGLSGKHEFYVQKIDRDAYSDYKEMAIDFNISEDKAKKMWKYSEELDKIKR